MRTFFVLIILALHSCSDNSGTLKNSLNEEKKAVIKIDLPVVFHRKYEGNINKNLSITLYLRKSGNQLQGYYVYNKINTPIFLKGTVTENKISLTEKSESGSVTGYFEGQFDDTKNISGNWENDKHTKTLPFSITEKKQLTNWWAINIPFHPAYINELLDWEGNKKTVKLNESFDMQGREMFEDSLGFEIVEEETIMRTPFFSYDLIGYEDEKYYFATTFCGGGTGLFTTIIAAEVIGDKLQLINTFGGGDRCNDGLTDYCFDKGKIEYSQNYTSEEFLSATNYDGELFLDDCAMCCFCTGNFIYDPSTKKSTFTGISLDLLNFNMEAEDAPDERKCFFDLVSMRVEKNNGDFSLKELELMGKELMQNCK